MQELSEHAPAVVQDSQSGMQQAHSLVALQMIPS